MIKPLPCLGSELIHRRYPFERQPDRPLPERIRCQAGTGWLTRNGPARIASRSPVSERLHRLLATPGKEGTPERAGEHAVGAGIIADAGLAAFGVDGDPAGQIAMVPRSSVGASTRRGGLSGVAHIEERHVPERASLCCQGLPQIEATA